ncbi:hypothetical protein NQZ68_023744 [Dissostichus eleginoides]|nr:hypothetical protein NQZ68_023744 [Dissostichus eleginoides]
MAEPPLVMTVNGLYPWTITLWTQLRLQVTTLSPPPSLLTIPGSSGDSSGDFQDGLVSSSHLLDPDQTQASPDHSPASTYKTCYAVQDAAALLKNERFRTETSGPIDRALSRAAASEVMDDAAERYLNPLTSAGLTDRAGRGSGIR